MTAFIPRSSRSCASSATRTGSRMRTACPSIRTYGFMRRRFSLSASTLSRPRQKRELTESLADLTSHLETLNNVITKLSEELTSAQRQQVTSEEELRKIWSNPTTRKAFLEKIAEAGYGKDELETLQKMIDAEQSDLFDILTYISFLTQPISRVQRVEQARDKIFEGLEEKQKEFFSDWVCS